MNVQGHVQCLSCVAGGPSDCHVEDDEACMQPEQAVHGQVGEVDGGELLPATGLSQPAKSNKRLAQDWDIQVCDQVLCVGLAEPL